MVREAGWRAVQMRHFDVQLIGGMVLHQGKIAEMKTGEGKTLVATLALLSECARRPRRARGHGERLPGQARRRVDGQDLRVPGPDRGRHRPRSRRQRAPRRLRRRHHLRHQQRIRLRLPARQHEVRDQGLRAARALLRHRRRSGLDPDRRSADAADHLRPHRPDHRQVRARAQDHSRNSNWAKRWSGAITSARRSWASGWARAKSTSAATTSSTRSSARSA